VIGLRDPLEKCGDRAGGVMAALVAESSSKRSRSRRARCMCSHISRGSWSFHSSDPQPGIHPASRRAIAYSTLMKWASHRL